MGDTTGETENGFATEALLSEHFMWAKPEPFRHLPPAPTTIPQWETLERETRKRLTQLRDAETPTLIEDEVEAIEFEWLDRKVLCERFYMVDLNSKDPFANSKIYGKIEAKLKDWDDERKKTQAIREELVKYLAAIGATDKVLNEPGKHITSAYAKMYLREPHEWPQMLTDCKEALTKTVKGYPDYKRRYAKIMERWGPWSKMAKPITVDKKHINDRNQFAAEKENDILRRPMYEGDHEQDAIYMAFDKEWRLMVFLDPRGIQWAFQNQTIRNRPVDEVLRQQSHEFYSRVRKPYVKQNIRHISAEEHLRRNPNINEKWSGSDHYGHWHAQAHHGDPVLETSESAKPNTATEKQLLLQFLHCAGGCMTRVLDFWFGVLDPELRSEYRRIYAESPRFARLPPTNDGHDETYCLRVSVCNRPTDEHEDASDMVKGFTGLVQLGIFTGAAMCIRKLGIALDGYKHGSVLLFKGTEMRHYISHWTGEYRYAFDHTTHRSLAVAIEYHKKHGRWGPKKPPSKPKDSKKSKDGDGDDDEDPDDGDLFSKSQDKPREPTKRKRGNDEEEHKPPGRLPTGPRKPRQAKEQRPDAGQKDQTQSQVTSQVRRNPYNLRSRNAKKA